MKAQTNILLLEGIHQKALDIFTENQYTNIETFPKALSGDDLVEKLQNIQLLGIRSRTQITNEVLAACPNLQAIGCFCIGTNQVDLEATQVQGIPVFNAPFANTRSVAELILSCIIQLMRGIPEKNSATRKGLWLKSAKQSFEVRRKKLGIVGYGNIGSQLSIMASNLGMHVYYYDIERKLVHGNARQCESLDELLSIADVVTLHTPATPETKNMINAKTLAQMKPGSYLINHARGNLIDIEALCEALTSGHIAGAALDVFPTEPKSKEDPFTSPLTQFDNVILTPHIGGSTQEAQENIAVDVATKLSEFVQYGDTRHAVNFPEVNTHKAGENQHRIMNIHENLPGMLGKINDIFSDQKINIVGQSLETKDNIGYVVITFENGSAPTALVSSIQNIPGSITTRLLF